jgi:starch phosphorylase
MKASMKMAMENFCSLRMAGEYDKRFYSVAGKRHDEMTANNAEEAKRIAQRVKRYKSLWKYIKIEQPEKDKAGTLRVGETFDVKAKVFLGELLPDEVDVEIYYGSVKGVEELKSGDTKIMSVRENLGNGNYLYSCTMTCADPGRFAYTTRVIPQGDDRLKFTPNLITWADQGN